MTETRQAISIRLSPTALARLNELGPNRSRIIESLILGSPTPTAEEPPLRQRLQASIDAVTGPCSHPRAHRIVTSIGYAKCGKCDKRLS